MLTPAFAVTATERVLPSLFLDFTTAVLDPRVTLTRSGNTATRINSSGLIETINANLPRFDYTLNTGGACKGLLIEDASTNYMKDWSDYGSAQWAKSATGSASIPSNTGTTTTAPDGGTAQIWSFTATGSDRSILAQTAAGTTGNWAASIYAKAGRAEDVGKIITIKETQGTTYALYTLTNQWQRIEDIDTSANTTRGLAIELRPGVGTSSDTVQVALWGAQAEPNDFVSSAIPNATAGNVTRNADFVAMTGTNFSSWFNASEGTLCANAIFASLTQPGQSGMVSISDGTNGRINIYRNSAGPWAVAVVSESGGQSAAYFPTISAQPIKTALAYKSGSVNFALNGTAGTTNTGMTNMPTGLDRLFIGSLNTGTAFLANGHLQTVRYYPIRLTNAELQAFSKL